MSWVLRHTNHLFTQKPACQFRMFKGTREKEKKGVGVSWGGLVLVRFLGWVKVFRAGAMARIGVMAIVRCALMSCETMIEVTCVSEVR